MLLLHRRDLKFMVLVSKPESSSAADVSLVIPCNHSREELIALLKAVFLGTLLPKEILIIRSGSEASTQKDAPSAPLLDALTADGLSKVDHLGIQIYDMDFAFPGEARNIGVNHARGDLIAFLDVKTIPEQNWLERACENLKDSNIDGVWGSRSYDSNTVLAGLIRDAIHGRLPVRSVAGSVFRRRAYSVTGQMISWTPAGEDGDWMHRIEAHKLLFLMPKNSNHSYQGLDNKSLLFFIKKWWRYYHYSRHLPVNNRDRWLSFGLIYIVLIFLAFNWNYKISAAILGSPLVVPHITTGLAIAGPIAYILVRAIYLPLRRGVPFLSLFPARFFLMLLVASILDFVKTLALLLPLPPEYGLGKKESRLVGFDTDAKQPKASSRK